MRTLFALAQGARKLLAGAGVAAVVVLSTPLSGPAAPATISTATPVQVVTVAPAPGQDTPTWSSVVVQRGDTLGGLARSTGLSVDAIARANPGRFPDPASRDLIQTGESLTLPAIWDRSWTVGPGDTVSGLGARFGGGVAGIIEANPGRFPTPQSADHIRLGETLQTGPPPAQPGAPRVPGVPGGPGTPGTGADDRPAGPDTGATPARAPPTPTLSWILAGTAIGTVTVAVLLALLRDRATPARRALGAAVREADRRRDLASGAATAALERTRTEFVRDAARTAATRGVGIAAIARITGLPAAEVAALQPTPQRPDPDQNHGHGHGHVGVPAAIQAAGEAVTRQWQRLVDAGLAVRTGVVLGLGAGAQMVLGLITGSVPLIGDGAHNLADLLPQAMMIVAAGMAMGTLDTLIRRAVGALILVTGLGLAAAPLLGAPPAQGAALVIAGGLIGIISNAVGAWVSRDSSTDSGKAAVQHALSDAVASVAVVAAGLGLWIGATWVEPVATVFVGAVVTVLGIGTLAGDEIHITDFVTHPVRSARELAAQLRALPRELWHGTRSIPSTLRDAARVWHLATILNGHAIRELTAGRADDRRILDAIEVSDRHHRFTWNDRTHLVDVFALWSSWPEITQARGPPTDAELHQARIRSALAALDSGLTVRAAAQLTGLPRATVTRARDDAAWARAAETAEQAHQPHRTGTDDDQNSDEPRGGTGGPGGLAGPGGPSAGAGGTGGTSGAPGPAPTTGESPPSATGASLRTGASSPRADEQHLTGNPTRGPSRWLKWLRAAFPVLGMAAGVVGLVLVARLGLDPGAVPLLGDAAALGAVALPWWWRGPAGQLRAAAERRRPALGEAITLPAVFAARAALPTDRGLAPRVAAAFDTWRGQVFMTDQRVVEIAQLHGLPQRFVRLGVVAWFWRRDAAALIGGHHDPRGAAVVFYRAAALDGSRAVWVTDGGRDVLHIVALDGSDAFVQLVAGLYAPRAGLGPVTGVVATVIDEQITRFVGLDLGDWFRSVVDYERTYRGDAPGLETDRRRESAVLLDELATTVRARAGAASASPRREIPPAARGPPPRVFRRTPLAPSFDQQE